MFKYFAGMRSLCSFMNTLHFNIFLVWIIVCMNSCCFGCFLLAFYKSSRIITDTIVYSWYVIYWYTQHYIRYIECMYTIAVFFVVEYQCFFGPPRSGDRDIKKILHRVSESVELSSQVPTSSSFVVRRQITLLVPKELDLMLYSSFDKHF